jgi:hypothetical protein
MKGKKPAGENPSGVQTLVASPALPKPAPSARDALRSASTGHCRVHFFFSFQAPQFATKILLHDDKAFSDQVFTRIFVRVWECKVAKIVPPVQSYVIKQRIAWRAAKVYSIRKLLSTRFVSKSSEINGLFWKSSKITVKSQTAWFQLSHFNTETSKCTSSANQMMETCVIAMKKTEFQT